MSANCDSIWRSATALLIGFALVGCGRGPKMDATVEGSVTVDGELAQRGSVTFNPVDKGPAASGRIFEDGSYRVGTGMGASANPDGGKLRAGEYVVTVLVSGESPEDGVVAKGGPPLAGPRLSAAKYMDVGTSALKFTVKKGRNVIDLALVGAAADPPPPEAEGDEDWANDDEEAPTENGSKEEDKSSGDETLTDEAPAASPDATATDKASDAPAAESGAPVQAEPTADAATEQPAVEAAPVTGEDTK